MDKNKSMQVVSLDGLSIAELEKLRNEFRARTFFVPAQSLVMY
jgi:ribosomal protein L10